MTAETDPRIVYLLAMARALHVSGYPAHRLESVLAATAARLGVTAQFFSTPTSLFAAFGLESRQHTHLLRVEPGNVLLERLDRLHAVGASVQAGTRTPGEGTAAIAAIMEAPPRWRGVVWLLAAAVSSACAARFLGGGHMEVTGAFAIGLVIAGLASAASRRAALGRVLTPLAGCIGAMIAGVAAAWFSPASLPIMLVGGLIALVPGFVLTVATSELAAGHLVSGTARLTGAIIQLIAMVIGVAIGLAIVTRFTGALPAPASSALPFATEWIALLVAPIALGIVFQAAPANFGWIVLIALVGFLGGRLGASALGPELGLLVGTLSAGLVNGFLARARGNQGTANMVPALIMLVPGSVGFRGLIELLNRNVVSGVELAFQTAIMTSSMSAGILLANALTPARGVEGTSVAVGPGEPV
ncbi:MAG TPA: threonine/serine exporter family protein [Candidatus Eisenbacteria bacterium]